MAYHRSEYLNYRWSNHEFLRKPQHVEGTKIKNKISIIKYWSMKTKLISFFGIGVLLSGAYLIFDAIYLKPAREKTLRQFTIIRE